MTPADVDIDPRALVASNAQLEPGVYIGPFATIGWEGEPAVRIGARTRVSPYALIEPGAKIGSDCVVDAYCRIAADVTIGDCTQILYGAAVYEEATVGSRCIVGGNVADRAVLENCVTFFGEIAHDHRHPGDYAAWDNLQRPSPVVRARSVVGQNAILIGDIEIGPASVVAAGEVVQVNVGPKMLYQRGKLVPLKRLRGLVKAREDGDCE